jgi:hypothetical protein
VAFLVLVCLIQAGGPNAAAPALYCRHHVAAGVRGSVAQARAHGLHRVVLPASYDQLLPDSLGELGCELKYAAPSPDWAQVSKTGFDVGLPNGLLDGDGVGVFLPAFLQESEPEQYRRVCRSLAAKQYRRVPIFYLDTSLAVWRTRLGVRPDVNVERREPGPVAPHGHERLVGHLFVRE